MCTCTFIRLLALGRAKHRVAPRRDAAGVCRFSTAACLDIFFERDTVRCRIRLARSSRSMFVVMMIERSVLVARVDDRVQLARAPRAHVFSAPDVVDVQQVDGGQAVRAGRRRRSLCPVVVERRADLRQQARQGVHRDAAPLLSAWRETSIASVVSPVPTEPKYDSPLSCRGSRRCGRRSASPLAGDRARDLAATAADSRPTCRGTLRGDGSPCSVRARARLTRLAWHLQLLGCSSRRRRRSRGRCRRRTGSGLPRRRQVGERCSWPPRRVEVTPSGGVRAGR